MITHARLVLTVACIVAISSTSLRPLFPTLLAESVPTDEKQLRAVAEASLSNRHAFPFLECKCTCRVGHADSIEKAVRSEFKPGDSVQTSVIRWVTDKDWVLFEEVCDPGVLKEAEEKARKSAPKEGTFPVKVSMATHANLTDGSWKLKYIQGMEAANIFDPNHSAPGVTTTPFSGNMMGQNEVRSPGNLLKDCASGKQVCHTITTENLDGRQLILVALGESREAVTCRFWLDPDRGFVPIRGSVFASTGEELHRTYWSDIRKCSGDRWFPCHWLAISIPRRADAGFSVRELTVTSFEADKRPTPDAFRLTIPGGTQIIDPHTKYALFHLKTDESVRPDEIKKLHDRCLLTVPVLRALNETAQGENHWPFGTITLICAGSVFALFGGARWYKHRRFRSQAANNAPPPAVP